MGSFGALPFYGIGLIAALMAAAKAHDGLFAAHAWVVAIACVIAIIATARRTSFGAKHCPSAGPAQLYAANTGRVIPGFGESPGGTWRASRPSRRRCLRAGRR